MATPEGADCRGAARRPGLRRAAAALAVCHPGPSLLVTATVLAAAGVLLRHAPGPGLAAHVLLVVLPSQLTVGAVNDLADAAADRAAGRLEKPLVTGAVSRALPLTVAAVGAPLSLGVAAATSAPALGVATLGLGAGLAYDLGLKRGTWALLPWWVGVCCIPLGAAAIAGTWRPGLAMIPALAALCALGLHLANAGADVAGDEAAGVRTLAVRLGPRRARHLSTAALVAVSAVAVATAPRLGQRLPPLALTAALLTAAALVVDASRLRRPFAVLAPAAVPLAVTWLATLP